jgi:hypothetical protein
MDKDKEVLDVTIDDVRNMTSDDRHNYLIRRRNWLQKVRKQDEESINYNIKRKLRFIKKKENKQYVLTKFNIPIQYKMYLVGVVLRHKLDDEVTVDMWLL